MRTIEKSRFFLLLFLSMLYGGNRTIAQTEQTIEFSSPPPGMVDEGNTFEEQGFLFEDEDSFDLDEEELSRLAENKELQQTECTAQTVVDILVGLGIQNILQQPFYLRSNSILNRSLHDLPTFSWTYADCPGFHGNLIPFYNQTSELFFTDSDPFIRSYVNLTGSDFLDAINSVISVVGSSRLRFDEILPLFQRVRLQERRAGLFLRLGSNYNDWTVQVSVPLYYLERNFFLTKDEIQRISFAPAINELAISSSQEEGEELLREHLVGDKIGLGDTRIHLLYNKYCDSENRLTVGGFVTLPTAHEFAEGIIGGSFCKSKLRPVIDLQQIICSVLSGEVAAGIRTQEKLISLAFNVLDHLSANVANTPLGNNEHLTLGPLIEYEHNWGDYFRIKTQASVQYVLPADEKRFFIRRINPREFDRDFTDPNSAEANLRFFERKIIDSLFPTVLRVQVRPGAIVNVNSAVLWNCGCVNTVFGYDFWWQGKEHIKSIPELRPFLVGRALNSPGMQHKFFGSLDFDIPQGPNLLRVGLRGDITFASSGVGKDFTLALNIQFRC